MSFNTSNSENDKQNASHSMVGDVGRYQQVEMTSGCIRQAKEWWHCKDMIGMIWE